MNRASNSGLLIDWPVLVVLLCIAGSRPLLLFSRLGHMVPLNPNGDTFRAHDMILDSHLKPQNLCQHTLQLIEFLHLLFRCFFFSIP